MTDRKFEFGDRVRHRKRPEWGVGTITKVEDAPSLNGHTMQRLLIRFPNAGMKTLIANHAELEHVTGHVDPYAQNQQANAAAWDRLKGDDFMGVVAERKMKEAMISLPSDVKDPFNSMAKRLTLLLALYRFDRSGRGLMDWAVAQTGLDDPLSRFTRHDLEQFFDRWAFEREQYLARLIQEARTEPAALQTAMKTAPPAAQHAVRRIIASR